MKVSKVLAVLTLAASAALLVSCSAITAGSESDEAADRASSTTVSTESALRSAVANASAGQTITLGANITIKSTLKLSKSGTSSSRITLNGNGKTITCSFSSGRGLQLTGSYWTITNMTITKAPDNGIVVTTGTGNNLTYVKTTWNSDSGIQVYSGAKNTYVYKCESYYNYDSANGGENADGFACKLSAGTGNKFEGCIAANNSDDGWDLYGQPYPVTMSSCTATYNGYYPSNGKTTKNGDGNGFKLGSAGISVKHVLSGCVSNYNLGSGYDGNGNTGHITMTSCTATGNKKASFSRIY
jgi:uncharacterized Zn ribbon protein